MTTNAKDMAGKKIGFVTVLRRNGTNKFNRALWICECECGKEVTFTGKYLRENELQSCGCKGNIKKIKHGQSHSTNHRASRSYQSWSSARGRCNNPKDKSYKHYGDRGITFYEGWNDFINFLSDMGECPPKFELDRIDVDKGYYPGNCRWVNNKDQANNRRNTNRVDINGETLTFYEISLKYAIPQYYLSACISRGENPSEIITKYHSGLKGKKTKFRGENSKATKHSKEIIMKAIDMYKSIPNVNSRKPKGTIEIIAKATGINAEYVKKICRGRTNWTSN